MFSWRARRQTLVLGFLLAIVGGAAWWGVDRLLPSPTCFDTLRNNGETDVDCGGPCMPCVLKNPKSVTVFWARAVPSRSQAFDVAAEIQNANEALASASVEYEFTLFDSSGPIAVRRGQTFLFAQERTVVVESSLETTRDPANLEFKIMGVIWQARNDPQPNVVVERHEYVRMDEGTLPSAIDAYLFNDTPFDFRTVEVIFSVFDAKENLIAVNRVESERFLSGSRRKVRSLWPFAFAEKPVTVRVEPRVNIFDPEVIIKPE